MIVNWPDKFVTAYGKKDFRISLRPGNNLIPDDVVAKLMAHSNNFKKDVDAGLLTLKKVEGATRRLAESDVAKASAEGTIADKEILAALPGMIDPEALKRISDDESRSGKVRIAARARLEKVLETPISGPSISDDEDKGAAIAAAASAAEAAAGAEGSADAPVKTVDQVKAEIKTSTNVPDLKIMAEEDPRKGVRDAAKARLKALAPK